ncbi:MAG: HAMP domain-containing protein [Gammaproteobacteria bacterium]|nr:HAMP domain-containing protein [Gammaproteobacteria bacterium]
MAMKLIKRLSSGTTPYFSLAVLLVVLAYLLTAATSDSSRLNDLFLVIFGLGLVILILLAAILVRSLHRLYKDFKQREAGSRLTVRLVSLFVLLILVSTTIVYSFSIHFLHRGINSWFDVEIEQALDDALELSRSSFGIRMRTLLRQTRLMSGVLSELPDNELNHGLRELNQLSGAIEMSIWNMNGQLITSSIENPTIMVPHRPDDAIFRQLEQQEDYIGLDPGDNDEFQLRAAVRIPKKSLLQQDRILHVMFPVNERLSTLGKTVQDAYTDYKELSYLRKPLITIFTLTLSLIVLLTVLASIWFAVWISRRIVHPLQELADGTQSVASGNYNTQLTTSNHDEIGFLVRSFNQMTQRLTQERNASQRSHRMLEQQTNYLGAVLGSLSSGVITLDDSYHLKTANVASSAILDVKLQHYLEYSLTHISDKHKHLEIFVDMILTQIKRHQNWQQQLELHPKKRRQSLMCRGTLLPNDAGWVIVFDDITTLLQAQRNAAWGEVARRLAHEIKNPLTPIQLSAERLQHKYGALLPDDQTDLLNKLTNTIIQQVDAMKDMVNDFSDYARNPGLQLAKHNIANIIKEVLALYQSHPNHSVSLKQNTDEIVLKVDSNRLRQVLHNLLKNAIEASEEANLPVTIEIELSQVQHNHNNWLELAVFDHGPGIPDEMLARLFEPYATNKLKGTGLGLAIVKKIIEEHHGLVWAENRNVNGACILIRLPLEDPDL